MLVTFPEHLYGGDAAVGEGRAVGWATRQRQGLRLRDWCPWERFGLGLLPWQAQQGLPWGLSEKKS